MNMIMCIIVWNLILILMNNNHVRLLIELSCDLWLPFMKTLWRDQLFQLSIGLRNYYQTSESSNLMIRRILKNFNKFITYVSFNILIFFFHNTSAHSKLCWVTGLLEKLLGDSKSHKFRNIHNPITNPN